MEEKNYYHIFNRGAHKVDIFLDKNDYKRFQGLLFVSNNKNNIKQDWFKRDFWIKDKPEEKLVDIIAYCIMPNHFHLCVRAKDLKDIEKYMRKLGIGYSMYFNLKYKHSGTIIQGRYKSVFIETDEQLRYTILYIHLNPFGLTRPEVDKYFKLNNLIEAKKISSKYEFSSYKDYLSVQRTENLIIEDVIK